MSCLGEDIKVLSTEMKSMTDELKNHKVLASDVLKRNIVHQNTRSNTEKKDEPMQWWREQTKYNNQNKTTSIFNWKKCIVLHNLARPQEIEKDEIRLHLCKVFGPMDITIINKYQFSREYPDRCKFIIQIEDDTQRTRIIEGWKTNFLGGSSMRHTVAKPTNILIVPNVPLAFGEEDILRDVNHEFRALCVKRLRDRDDRPLRAISIQFQSENETKKAMEIGKIKFPSMYNIILSLKTPGDKRNTTRHIDE